jgi:hypothetical protein
MPRYLEVNSPNEEKTIGDDGDVDEDAPVECIASTSLSNSGAQSLQGLLQGTVIGVGIAIMSLKSLR